MSTGPRLTIEEQRVARKKAERKEKTKIAKFKREHPLWNNFTRNQKRNMRKRLQKIK